MLKPVACVVVHCDRCGKPLAGFEDEELHLPAAADPSEALSRMKPDGTFPTVEFGVLVSTIVEDQHVCRSCIDTPHPMVRDWDDHPNVCRLGCGLEPAEHTPPAVVHIVQDPLPVEGVVS